MPRERPLTTLPTTYKAHADDRELSVRAVLSSGERDLAGELVELAGLDFTSHSRDPWVDLEHNGTFIAGWARKSFGASHAPYSVAWAKLNFGGDDAADWRTVPVGTTYFDPNSRAQSQTFALVKSGALPGVSLEFRPRVRKAAPNPWSDLEGRPAYDYPEVDVIRWTLCKRPVCDDARTEVLKAEDALARILRDKRIHTGTSWEPLETVIYKALKTQASTSVSASVGKAAMPDEQTPVYEADPMATETGDVSAGDDSATPPMTGISAIYAHVEALLDACDQLEMDLANTDNGDLYKDAMKLCEGAKALAEKAKGVGDKHDSKLQSAKGGGEEKAEGEEDETDTEGDDDSADEDADIERDDEGTLKAIRPCYARVLKARRFKKAEIDAGVKKATEESAAAAAESEAAELAEAEARRQAALRKFKKANALYG